MYLAGVLSSLEVASAEHAGGDPVGVGALTVLLGQDGQVQAVQAFQTPDWITHRNKRDTLVTIRTSGLGLNHEVIFMKFRLCVQNSQKHQLI